MLYAKIRKVNRKISSVLATIKIKILCGKAVEFGGVQAIRMNTRFIAEKSGTIKMERISAGHNVHFSSIGGQLRIGKGVSFNRNCIVICRKSITIADSCMFGPNVVIYDHDHKFNHEGVFSNEFNLGTVQIDKNCWIGAGVIILKDTHIGEGCVIGAGAVLSGNIPAHSIVVSERRNTIRPIEDRL